MRRPILSALCADLWYYVCALKCPTSAGGGAEGTAMRAHIVLPEQLIDEVDRVAGRRRRSRFVEVAIREKLAHEALGSALRESAGVLRPDDYLAWKTPSRTSAWVRASRAKDDERLAGKARAPRS